MIVIGITGGTGAGKTTALGALEDLGALVIDCDALYHDLLERDKVMLAEIDAAFPGTVTDGKLDRKVLGAAVFSDPDALAKLNQVTHKYVGQAVEEALAAHAAAGGQLAAVDAIALLEGGLADKCDAVVAITAPAEVRVQRIMAREGIPYQYALLRIGAQQTDAYYQAHCDRVLVNDGTDPAAFRQACREIFATMITAIKEEKDHGCQ